MKTNLQSKVSTITRIRIHVHPHARTEKVEYDEQAKFWRVSVTAPAEDNKANIAVIKLFKKMLKKPVRIVSGLTSREKVLEVL